jgi:hypothetical protein
MTYTASLPRAVALQMGAGVEGGSGSEPGAGGFGKGGSGAGPGGALPDKDGPDFYLLGHSAALSGRFVLGHPQG